MVILTARIEESTHINGFVCDTKQTYAHCAYAVHTKTKQVIANRYQKSRSRSHNTAKQELKNYAQSKQFSIHKTTKY